MLREWRSTDAAGASRVRILHLNAGQHVWWRGIAPHHSGQLAGAVPGDGAAFRVLLRGPVQPGDPGRRRAVASCWACTRISRPWTVWRARRRLRELLRKERFDLVVCHMEWTLAIFGGVVRAAGHKVTLWMHGFQAEGHWLERLARRNRPDLAIANSRFTASEVTRPLPPNAGVGNLLCRCAARGFMKTCGKGEHLREKSWAWTKARW